MKVLHLLSSNRYAGAEHVAMTIIQGLQNKYDCVYVSPEGDVEEVLKRENIKFIGLGAFDYFNIKQAVKVFQPDIIHAHDYKASCIATIINFKGKIISHIHNNNLWARQLNMKTMFFAVACNRFSKVAVVSESVVEEFYFSKLLANKAVVVSNVVDYQKIKKMSEIEEVKTDILFVGRLSPPKNPLRFINIIDLAKKRMSKLKVNILGDGELKEDCLSLIEKLNLTEEITLLGFNKNPYSYMKSSKVLVMTSNWEGFGLVALEAMLLGIPVISTNVGGLTNLSYDRSRFVCKTDKEIEDAIIRVLSMNDYEYRKLSEEIKVHAHAKNNYDIFINEWTKIYECES